MIAELDTTDSLHRKVQVYENFLHLLQMYAEVTMNPDKVRRLIERACSWSYAHRQGNGELSEEEQHALVEDAFEKLCDIDSTPTSRSVTDD